MNMKQSVTILIFIFFSVSLIAQQKNTDKHFYYYKGKPFYLQTDYSRISIVSEIKATSKMISNASLASSLIIKNSEKSHTNKHVLPISDAKNRKQIDVFNAEIEIQKKIDNTTYYDLIQDLQKRTDIIKASPTFTLNDKEIGLSNNFYVKLFAAKDLEILNSLAKKYSISVLGYNEFMPLWYTLACTKETPFNAIEAANIFYEIQLFESSEPEFLYNDLAASNDELYSKQWGLKNTGQYNGVPNIDINVENAWNITTGSPNIRVAVFDHGFDLEHSDLKNNVHGSGYDITTNSIPSIIRGVHGTPCAGIIGAIRNNTIGIAGVAPTSKLISISTQYTYDTPQQYASGFQWAWKNGADIISCSWGGGSPSDYINNAIADALTLGRNGKGTVIVFASGNTNTNVMYPANSNPAIIAVGAISPCGERKSPTSCDGNNDWLGSCYGPQLDVVAPGTNIPVTDNRVSPEYVANNDYFLNFWGTSAACPHVAGIAALILSVNPELTAIEVSNIIESTAQKVNEYSSSNPSGYVYSIKSERANGTWNNEMGYGLVDAYAAVQAASCTTVNFTNQIVTTQKIVFGCDINVQNITVQNNAKLTLDAANVTTINGPFEIKQGSQLEIK